jgi:Family of unknown function (DUF6328)
VEGGNPKREETEAERLDRNLLELLNELRVALPGVQVLFAFLLAVPFSPRFELLNSGQEKIYYAILACAALSTAFLIAPSAHHRIEFRAQDKAHIVFLANRFAIAGLTFLALAMIGVVLFITDVLFTHEAAAIATVIATLVFGWLWYGIPIYRLVRHKDALWPEDRA